MKTLKGEKIFLRALEPEDLQYVYDTENDDSLWHLSNTQTPFSRYTLKEYLDNAHRDIFEVKQLRLIISDYGDNPIGMIDLFDCDFKNGRAGIGILIGKLENRNVGYGKEALNLLIEYAFKHLNFHQLYCNISEENNASLRLFKNQGFTEIGLKKDWNMVQGEFKNEYLLQLIKK